jgi:catechol 2,3-dioxygenase-like lactoylglutathione lyase family enzyme
MLFVKDVPGLAAFYRDVLGCEPIGEITPGWAELRAGGCNIALHRQGACRPGQGGPGNTKLVFGTADVPATRAELETRGVKMGAIHSFDNIQICDGSDPEGNRFQISSRGI